MAECPRLFSRNAPLYMLNKVLNTSLEHVLKVNKRWMKRKQDLSIFNKCSTSIPLENIRKPSVFGCFQGGIEVDYWLKMS